MRTTDFQLETKVYFEYDNGDRQMVDSPGVAPGIDVHRVVVLIRGEEFELPVEVAELISDDPFFIKSTLEEIEQSELEVE